MDKYNNDHSFQNALDKLKQSSAFLSTIHDPEDLSDNPAERLRKEEEEKQLETDRGVQAVNSGQAPVKAGNLTIDAAASNSSIAAPRKEEEEKRSRQNELVQLLAQLDAQIQAIDTRLGEIDNRLAEIEQDMSAIEDGVLDADDRARLENAASPEEYDAIMEQIMREKLASGELSEEHFALWMQLREERDQLRDEQQELKDQKNELENERDDIERDIAQLREQADTLEEERQLLEQQMDELAQERDHATLTTETHELDSESRHIANESIENARDENVSAEINADIELASSGLLDLAGDSTFGSFAEGVAPSDNQSLAPSIRPPFQTAAALPTSLETNLEYQNGSDATRESNHNTAPGNSIT